MPDPKVGDQISVESASYLSHGRDDFQGGLAEIVEVTNSVFFDVGSTYVRVKELPDTWLNWPYLEKQQEALRTRFRDQRAHADPDYRPQFNEE